MEDFQCTIEEMPCYDASAVSSDVDPSTTPTSTPVPTPGTPPTDALLAPTASPTTTTPDAERSLDVTAAPSSSDSSSGNATEMPSALSEACAGVAAACDAEDDCREGCYAGVVEVKMLGGCVWGGGGEKSESTYMYMRRRFCFPLISCGWDARRFCDVATLPRTGSFRTRQT